MPDIPPKGRLAAVMAHVTLLAAVALPLATAAIWIFWDQLAPRGVGNLVHFYDVTSLGLLARLAGFSLFLFGAGVQAYGLLGLRRTFQEAAAGNALSARAVLGFRRFAWVALAMVFIGIVQQTGLIAIISASDPARPGALSINLGTNELKALFMALLLVFVAHVFAEAKKTKDENAAFL